MKFSFLDNITDMVVHGITWSMETGTHIGIQRYYNLYKQNVSRKKKKWIFTWGQAELPVFYDKIMQLSNSFCIIRFTTEIHSKVVSFANDTVNKDVYI